MSVTSIRLNQDIEEPLEQLACKMNRSKNYLINQAIKEFIGRHSLEDERWDQTLEALDSVKNGRIVDGDTVIEWLKRWGTDNEQEKPSP